MLDGRVMVGTVVGAVGGFDLEAIIRLYPDEDPEALAEALDLEAELTVAA